jgi:hypothetical protein
MSETYQGSRISGIKMAEIPAKAKPGTIEYTLLPLEERWKFTVDVCWGALWVEMPIRLVKFEGWDWDRARKWLINWTKVDGPNDAKWLADLLKIEEKLGEGDATTAFRVGYAGLINDGFVTPGFVEVVEYAPKRCVVRIFDCATLRHAKERGVFTEDKLAPAIPKTCEVWWQEVAKTVNPKLKSKFESFRCRLPKGDEYCQHVLELEE